MLNERTADVAVEAPPDDPGPLSVVAALREVAGFLEAFPGIPEPYVTVSGDSGQVGVQLPSHVAEAEERCMAVARIAQAHGAATLVQSGTTAGRLFETHVITAGHPVHVYAPIEGPRDASAGGAA